MAAGVHHLQPNFIVIDGKILPDGFASLAEFKKSLSESGPYVFLIVDDQLEGDLMDAVEAGVDDFLNKPLANAEILTRLRAAERYCDARLKGHGTLETNVGTGLHTREAMESWIDRQCERNYGLIILEIDYFDQIGTSLGTRVAHSVLVSVSELIRELAESNFIAAELQGGRFAVLVPEVTPDQVRPWAERFRDRIETCDTVTGIDELELTVSMGISGRKNDLESFQEVWGRAESARRVAVQSGRDAIVLDTDLAVDGMTDVHANPFSTAKASDVMIPAVLVLDVSEKAGVASAKLDRSQVHTVPVVDQHRRFQGVVRRTDLSASSDVCTLRSIVKDDVLRVREDMPLSSVVRQLADHQLEVAIVLQGEEPSGIISCRELFDLMESASASASVKDADEDDFGVESASAASAFPY